MSDTTEPKKEKFAPKQPVTLNPPKDDVIERDYLAKCDVFAGKEPNRALGMSSLKPEDCISDYSGLSDKEKQVLNDWHTFFSKRYNIVGRLPSEGANL
ncbi:cytochrome b5 [Stemphylium lycopersici]|uniref:Cytochrome b5 n=1 Tax=Stemphylium lycopersici TaxID=183478 RepID=A0A364NCY5_STELY|nr:cytochrome b5 [Stemphylium lycopersici]RAR15178.1 cytochrome b5 [Stemphylium lycopersici]